jgi:hypothetical protein
LKPRLSYQPRACTALWPRQRGRQSVLPFVTLAFAPTLGQIASTNVLDWKYPLPMFILATGTFTPMVLCLDRLSRSWTDRVWKNMATRRRCPPQPDHRPIVRVGRRWRSGLRFPSSQPDRSDPEFASRRMALDWRRRGTRLVRPVPTPCREIVLRTAALSVGTVPVGDCRLR